MHIHFNIEDPRWAVVLAGVAVNGKEPGFKEINPAYNISFEPVNPVLEYISRHFSPKPNPCEPYSLPAESQYPFIDQFNALTQAKNLFEQHGIAQEPQIVPLYVPYLAYNTLLLTHGIASKPGYFFPKPSKKVLDTLDPVDCIVEDETMLDLAKHFMNGLGVSNPVIEVYGSPDSLESAQKLFKAQALISRPHHVSQYICRSQYRGFDFIHENIPVLSVIDDTCIENRYLLSWNAQIPATLGEPIDHTISKGKAWKIRKHYKFDHRAFFADYIKGTVKV